ncbi:MAG: HAD family phosphatase [Patescibacteria group bacterium]
MLVFLLTSKSGIVLSLLEVRLIKKVLFDLDGTLWDTQKFHAQIESQLMATHGIHVSADDISDKYAGVKTERVFMELMGCPQPLAAELSDKKWGMLLPLAKEAREMCDLRRLFTQLQLRGVELAIGTASPVMWAQRLLDINGLYHFFRAESIVGRDMVQEGKPHPEVWLKAAGNTPLSDCLVVEDGIAGIEAAEAAEIPSVLLLPKRHPSAYSIRNISDILDLF